MSPILLLASLVGQLATPQSRAVETAPGPSQTLVLLQYAQPSIPGTSGVLVNKPCFLHGLFERTGYALVGYAKHHQHPQMLTPVNLAPAMVTAVPATLSAPVSVPITAKPVTYAVPSAQSEAAPPPPSPSCSPSAPAPSPAPMPPLTPTAPILLVPDPTRQQQIHHYFTIP